MLAYTPRLGGEGPEYLGKVDAKCVHIQAIEKTRKGFAEARQTLVHYLEMHHVRLKVGHGIRQFGKGGLERVEGERAVAIDTCASRVAK